MAIVFEFLPEEVIQLQREISENHPELVSELHAMEDKDFYVQLAKICAYCDIIVDGWYLPADIRALADLCTMRLRQRRQIVIY